MPSISLHSTPSSATFSSQSPLERLEKAASGHPLHQNSNSHNYDDFDDIILQPPSNVLTTKRTSYSHHCGPPNPLEGYRFESHRRTLTESFLDKVKPAVTRAPSQFNIPSPTKSLASFMPSLSTPADEVATASKATSASTARPRFPAFNTNSWFSGTSAPITLGIIPSSPSESERRLSYSEEDDSERPTVASMATQLPARFSWLKSQVNTTFTSLTRPSTASSYHTDSDPLLNLDVTAELFPHGAPDPLAPHAFHDLLNNAEKLIARLQTGYRQRCRDLHDIRLEKDAQDEEFEEADTRARHLKTQLDCMAAKAKENEQTIKTLVEEITEERRLRSEAEIVRKRQCSIRVVRAQEINTAPSDSGFESSGDDASIFTTDSASMPQTPASRCGSPTQEFFEKKAQIVTVSPKEPYSNGSPNRRLTYGWTSKARVSDVSEISMRGADSSRTLTEQNRVLRERIVELESALDGCLDLVNGVGL